MAWGRITFKIVLFKTFAWILIWFLNFLSANYKKHLGQLTASQQVCCSPAFELSLKICFIWVLNCVSLLQIFWNWDQSFFFFFFPFGNHAQKNPSYVITCVKLMAQRKFRYGIQSLCKSPCWSQYNVFLIRCQQISFTTSSSGGIAAWLVNYGG